MINCVPSITSNVFYIQSKFRRGVMMFTVLVSTHGKILFAVELVIC